MGIFLLSFEKLLYLKLCLGKQEIIITVVLLYNISL